VATRTLRIAYRAMWSEFQGIIDSGASRVYRSHSEEEALCSNVEMVESGFLPGWIVVLCYCERNGRLYRKAGPTRRSRVGLAGLVVQ